MRSTTFDGPIVSEPDKVNDIDRGRWRLLYAMSMMTVLLTVAVSIESYRQNQDRGHVKQLATQGELISAQNRVGSCAAQNIRNHTTPMTQYEVELYAYFKSHPYKC